MNQGARAGGRKKSSEKLFCGKPRRIVTIRVIIRALTALRLPARLPFSDLSVCDLRRGGTSIAHKTTH